MNKFIEKYKEEREAGNNFYESLGITASYIALIGSFEDLEIVYHFFSQDLKEEMDKWIVEESVEVTDEEFITSESSYVSSDYLAMKDVGHKLSDFE